MATLFVDFEGGNNDFSGTSFSVLASGTNGRISSNTFSSSTASFVNNGTLCNTTNLLGGSERLFDTAKWTVSNSTITTINLSPPSGVDCNVHVLKEDSSTSGHNISTSASMYTTTNLTQYTISLYAKSAGRDEIVVRFDSTGTALGVRYNLSTVTVVESGASATGTISSIGDGWYRLTLTANATGTNNRIFIGLTNGSHTSTSMQTYAGDGSSGIYLAGLQLQTGSSATTYEKSPTQYLSIFNGTIYAVYEIMQYLSSTSLFITTVSGGTALANQTVDRQFYIGGRWQNLTNGATGVRLMEGDTVRVMGSPDPTPIGSGTWTGQQMPLSVAITSSTNASPISINCASTMSSLGLSTGDTVFIANHATNTNANGTWEITVPSSSGTSFTLNGSTGNGVGGATGRFRKKTNCVVRLNSALTANIASYGNRGEGRTAWTASANVTATLNANTTKEGDVSDDIVIAAAFTTGKAAYKATGTLDLSGYQQISFWIRQYAGTTTVSGDISLRLCSDTTGDTTVHTFDIGSIGGSTDTWIPITLNLGSNMNNSIKSIALYVDTDRGSVSFSISNIIACKAVSSDDSLNLCSLISKNIGDEAWYALSSINGTRVMIGNNNNTTSLTGMTTAGDRIAERGYYGTTETITTYKRETIKVPRIASGTAHTLNQAGTENNVVNYKFGWDRTNMSNQNLVTYLDGSNGLGNGLTFANYVNVDRVGIVRYNNGFLVSTSFCTLDLEWAIACSTYCWNPAGNRNTYVKMLVNSGGSQGVLFSGNLNTINKFISINNTANGIRHDSCNDNKFYNITCLNNAAAALDGGNLGQNIYASGTLQGNSSAVGFTSSDNCVLKSLNISDNTSYGIVLTIGSIIVDSCTIDQAIEGFNSSFGDSRIHFINNDNVPNNNFTITDVAIITPQTSIRNTASGYAWAMSPTSINRSSLYPLDLKVATVAVIANSLVTVKAWVRRSNTGLTMGLRLKGDQIAGVPNDVTSYMTAAADTWQQITLTFTPTEAGVVEILAECYGGTTFTGYIDDLTITQA